MEIWCPTKGPGDYGINWGSPSVPGRDPLVHADKPFGEWNQLNIKMTGDRVTVNLNQKLVVNDSPLMNYWGPPYSCKQEKAAYFKRTHSASNPWWGNTMEKYFLKRNIKVIK